MENLIRTYFGDAESNCGKQNSRRGRKPCNDLLLICLFLECVLLEWSVLYVTIASFMIVVAIATVIWGVVCCCRR